MALIATILAALGLGTPAGAQATISRDDVKAGLAAGTHVLIDVREADEFAAGHVAGAANQPLSRFDPQALPTDGRTVVLMCRSGRRSAMAQAAATKAGIPTLNYAGSILEWTAAGEPVVTGKAGGR